MRFWRLWILVTLPLLGASPAWSLDGFDFAVERLEVIGNGAFLDAFDDGQRGVPPTARIVDRLGSRTTETGGVLRLTDRDGAARRSSSFVPPSALSPFVGDSASLTNPIVAGRGAADVRATYRPDVPREGSEYGLQIHPLDFGLGPPGVGGILLVRVTGDANGQLLVSASNGATSAPISPAQIVGGLVLRVIVTDAAPGVNPRFSLEPSYSLDGGAHFTVLGSPVGLEIVKGRLFPLVYAFGATDAALYGASLASEVSRGAGGALIGAQGSLFDLGTLAQDPLYPIGAQRPGSFAIASMGSVDLRRNPGIVEIDTGDGNLVATATRANEVRRVDLSTGRPIAGDAPANATCTTGNEPGCWTLGRTLAQSQNLFDEICAWSRGFSALDRSICALTVYNSQGQPLPGVTIANALSTVLGGGFGATIVYTALAGTTAFPVPLEIGPSDNLTLGLPGGVGSGPFGSLSSALSDTQEAIAGCGVFFGPSCHISGIQILHSEASALLQSFLGSDGTDETWLASDGSRTQPGTVPLPVGPVFETPCTRFDGVGVVTLPGCRTLGAPGYDPSVDGSTTGQLHPFVGQPFQAEWATLSWNLEQLHVAFSSPDGDGALVPGTTRFRANEPDEFDEFDKLRTDGCSFAAPALCRSQRSLRSVSVRELPDDPSGPPARRWAWETGAEYAITSASGRFAAFLGGRLHAIGPVEPLLPGYAAGVAFLLEPPPPRPDTDADGVDDAVDVCPHVSNPNQSDVGGVGSGSSADGIGDACQCGDVSGDGRVTITDSVLITRSLLIPPTATLARPGLCDVGGAPSPATQDCTLVDAVILRRAQLVPPTGVVEQSCAAATP